MVRLDELCVLLVHEDRFQANYLAEVFRRAGAAVAGPTATAPDAIARLTGDPPPAALVLSSMVEGGAELSRLAIERQVRVLQLLPNRGVSPEGLPADRTLSTPFSAFQAAEAVAELVRDRAAAPPAGVTSDRAEP